MKDLYKKEKMEVRLFEASSYLRVAADNYIMFRGNVHPYCRLVSGYDEKEATKKPSKLKRLLHTFF